MQSYVLPAAGSCILCSAARPFDDRAIDVSRFPIPNVTGNSTETDSWSLLSRAATASRRLRKRAHRSYRIAIRLRAGQAKADAPVSGELVIAEEDGRPVVCREQDVAVPSRSKSPYARPRPTLLAPKSFQLRKHVSKGFRAAIGKKGERLA